MVGSRPVQNQGFLLKYLCNYLQQLVRIIIIEHKMVWAVSRKQKTVQKTHIVLMHSDHDRTSSSEVSNLAFYLHPQCRSINFVTAKRLLSISIKKQHTFNSLVNGFRNKLIQPVFRQSGEFLTLEFYQMSSAKSVH